jgi:hypothetical protein
MSKGYSEDALAEKPAIEFLAGLIPAVNNLNPQAPAEAIVTAVNELPRDLLPQLVLFGPLNKLETNG